MDRLIDYAHLASDLYDLLVPDWPGEIDFYRELARDVTAQGGVILEVGCGTGRVALQLVRDGATVVGTDLDPAMLAQARRKNSNVRWVQSDMRSLDLGQAFELIIIPGHSFQFMLTPEDQVRALECFRRHLVPGGVLCIHLDHQDVSWLAGLGSEPPGVFGPGQEVTHPRTGQTIRKSNAWIYEPSTQTATVTVKWEVLAEGGTVVETRESAPKALHCVFRYEMEHLLARLGFEITAVYGDFYRNALAGKSPGMLWVARRPC
jgi:SAM-dependent methyltransferase